ncbi:diguanylate cyclase [Alteromonas sp. 5E99-2]|uniref:sensor domain-containing diguanylate cyclase n=1 Tax=Alteromonas sp. 5E99-2 TaxID=2817683 RepID=UPI001A98789B|nr:diguanylate cyclase [Alteromonas sp. 5E99-2]MBO1254595.1 diguanylate cyclase [Alteromonas sp. 5E99-2]
MQFPVVREKIRQKWIIFAAVFVLSIYLLFTFALTSLPVESYNVDSVYILHGESESLGIDDVRQVPSQSWAMVATPVNLGMNQGTYWLKFHIPENSSDDDDRLFEITYPLLDKVDIWLYSSAESDVSLDVLSFGDSYPFDSRLFDYESFIVDFSKYATSPRFGIMRVHASGSMKVPMRLWQPKEFIEFSSHHHLVVGCLFGFLVAMALSNLFFFVTTNSVSFIFYTGHVLCFSLVCAALFGFGYEYIWPNQVWLQERAIGIFSSGAMLFAMLFSNVLLDLKNHSAHLSAIAKGMGAAFFVNILLSFFLPLNLLMSIFFLVLVLSVFFILSVCIWLSWKKVVVARYYSIAWLLLLISGVGAIFENIGILNLPGGISGLLLFGISGETFFLAFVLALSYRSQRQALDESRKMALRVGKESADAKDKLIALEQKAKDDLEYKVQERTLELEITLRELSEANSELEQLNTIDPLTSIRNRRYFDKRIVAEGRRSRREQTTLCLVMLDIDFFKRINDEYGHDVGDECLKHVSTLAKSFIKRPSDDICRYGGEEFAFILPQTPEEGAKKFVNSIREKIEATPYNDGNTCVAMTISAGVASGVVNHEDGEKDILKLADRALYLAKESGRNQICTAADLEK